MHIAVFLCVVLLVGIVPGIYLSAKRIISNAGLVWFLTAILAIELAVTIIFDECAVKTTENYEVNVVVKSNKVYVKSDEEIPLHRIHELKITDEVSNLSLLVTRKECLGLWSEYYTLVIPKGVVSNVTSN